MLVVLVVAEPCVVVGSHPEIVLRPRRVCRPTQRPLDLGHACAQGVRGSRGSERSPLHLDHASAGRRQKRLELRKGAASPPCRDGDLGDSDETVTGINDGDGVNVPIHTRICDCKRGAKAERLIGAEGAALGATSHDLQREARAAAPTRGVSHDTTRASGSGIWVTRDLVQIDGTHSSRRRAVDVDNLVVDAQVRGIHGGGVAEDNAAQAAQV
mmetsp:Transcript_32160/g.81956  ORF Transcript_32160/g.81956 Transcript_32160/m.81956 type:complete len:213 (+) Transcript_32160:1465-2103(+)